jgi:hypothetical protein
MKAIEELHSHVLFQRSDMPADGLTADSEFARRTRQT